MVTGKNKEQFEDFVTDDDNLMRWNFSYGKNGLTFEDMDFYKLPFEMQIGVYLAYYDSLGVNIDVLYIFAASSFLWEIEDIKDELGLISDHCGGFESRNEAYKEAFKTADEITNNKN